MKLEIENMELSHRNNTCLIPPLSLKVEPNEIVVIFGPSGSGKSSLLNALAGFIPILNEKNTSGKKTAVSSKWFKQSRLGLTATGNVYMGGVKINSVSPQNRPIGFVQQEYGTYPHMTAKDNIAFPLLCRGTPAIIIDEKVKKAAQAVGFPTQFLDRRARSLSGGERQRVAIAKMLAKEASIGLLDEPFSHLDQILRIELITLLRNLVDTKSSETLSCSMIVSHDWRDVCYANKVLLVNAREDGIPQIRCFNIPPGERELVLMNERKALDLDANEFKWLEGLQEVLHSYPAPVATLAL